MKKIILSSTIAALLLLSGCSTNQPEINDANGANGAKNTQKSSSNSANNAETISDDTVLVVDGESSNSNSNGSEVVSADSNELSMSGVESTLTTVNFGFDKFDLSNEALTTVESNAKVATTTGSDYTLKLEGNCDEWGSDEYNYALGLKRAHSVKKSLVSQGVDAGRITMVSYGESNPVCNDKNDACWMKNRRVDFKLLP
jgi:peptidoglycan-associated lipoprotein